MSQLLFGYKFGSLEKLAAGIWVMLYIPSLFFLPFSSYFSHFHKYSCLFKLDYLHIVPLGKRTLSRL